MNGRARASPSRPRARRRLLLPGLLLAFFLATALGATPATEAAVTLGATPGTASFGEIARGGAATAEVTLRNGGDQALDVTIGFENAEEGTLTATPATVALAPGGTTTIAVALAVPSDAVPGRHEPALLAQAATSGTGNQANAAVRVALPYTVQAVDVAYAAALNGARLDTRVVNGHATARTIDLQLATTVGGVTAERLTLGAQSVPSLGSLLHTFTLNASLYPDGTHVVRLNGTAKGGGAPEPFEAVYDLYAASGALSLDERAPSAGQGRTRPQPPPETPAPGGAAPDLPIRPVPQAPPTPGEDEASDDGIPATPSAVSQAPPVAPRTTPERAAFAIAAVTIAAVAGLLLFMGRHGLGP